jgi:hypothetical protein
MHFLKLIRLSIVQTARQIRLIPRVIGTAVGQWRQRAAFKEAEIERIDRIRHPYKYLGK